MEVTSSSLKETLSGYKTRNLPLVQGRSCLTSVSIFLSAESTTTEVTLVATPKDRIVALGSRVSLYCIAESDPAADIRWFKNGQEVEEAVIRGNGEVLEILNATLDIAGNYTCIASNGFSSKNSTASLSVVGKLQCTSSM